jgi:hypothetical protein
MTGFTSKTEVLKPNRGEMPKHKEVQLLHRPLSDAVVTPYNANETDCTNQRTVSIRVSQAKCGRGLLVASANGEPHFWDYRGTISIDYLSGGPAGIHRGKTAGKSCAQYGCWLNFPAFPNYNGLFIETNGRFFKPLLTKLRYNHHREIECKGKHR